MPAKHSEDHPRLQTARGKCVSGTTRLGFSENEAFSSWWCPAKEIQSLTELHSCSSYRKNGLIHCKRMGSSELISFYYLKWKWFWSLEQRTAARYALWVEQSIPWRWEKMSSYIFLRGVGLFLNLLIAEVYKESKGNSQFREFRCLSLQGLAVTSLTFFPGAGLRNGGKPYVFKVCLFSFLIYRCFWAFVTAVKLFQLVLTWPYKPLLPIGEHFYPLHIPRSQPSQEEPSAASSAEGTEGERGPWPWEKHQGVPSTWPGGPRRKKGKQLSASPPVFPHSPSCQELIFSPLTWTSQKGRETSTSEWSSEFWFPSWL